MSSVDWSGSLGVIFALVLTREWRERNEKERIYSEKAMSFKASIVSSFHPSLFLDLNLDQRRKTNVPSSPHEIKRQPSLFQNETVWTLAFFGCLRPALFGGGGKKK